MYLTQIRSALNYHVQYFCLWYDLDLTLACQQEVPIRHAQITMDSDIAPSTIE